ncbi:ATP-binding protein [Anaerolineales bacterium HSG6]|nr:ATP-binding protein [Anaerolineales bacterium HSG6]
MKLQIFLQKYWRNLSINSKFRVVFGLFLLLIVFIALTGFFALTAVHTKTKATIVNNMEFQRLVLEMDNHLQHARRLEKDFFRNWPIVGYEQAYQEYVSAYRAEIIQLNQANAELQELVTAPDTSDLLRPSYLNLSSYRGLINLYADRFEIAVNNVSELGATKSGILTTLTQNSVALQKTLTELNQPELNNIYLQMETLLYQYQLTHDVEVMQNLLTILTNFQRMINDSPELNIKQKEALLALFELYEENIREIRSLTVEIESRVNSFDQHMLLFEPISEQLIILATRQVIETQNSIEQTTAGVRFLLGLAVIVSLLLTAWLAYLLNHSVTKKISHLTEVAVALQNGNLDTQAHIDSADELGQLSASFNAMAEQIKTLISNLQTKAGTAETRLAQAINSISEGLVLFDAADKLILCNNKYLDMHIKIADILVPEVQFETLLQAGITRGIYMDAIQRPRSWFEEQLAQHRSPTDPFELQMSDGRWLLISENRTQDGGICAIQADITARKQTESELRQLLEIEQEQRQLAESLRELAVILNQSLELDIVLVKILEELKDVLAYDGAGILLQQGDFLILQQATATSEKFLNHRIPLQLDTVATQVFKTKKPLIVADVHDEPAWIIWSGGEKINCWMGAPLIIGDETIGVITTDNFTTDFYDDDDLNVLQIFATQASIAIHNAQLFNDIQTAKELADAANEAKSSFLANVSHELRTPLTSILGFSKIIQKRLENRIFPQTAMDDRKTKRAVTQVRKNIQIIISEGERLTSLINNVLDLAKIESGKIEWRMVPLNLSDIIDQSLAATSALLTGKNIKLERDVEPNLPRVIGDEHRLMQVIINLLSNAIKFTSDGGSVTCCLKKEANEILVSIIDTGMGIPDTELLHVFEKFRQIGDTLTDKPQGTGLGLPICKQIVEHHSGRIWAESAVEQGSTFFFTIPIPDHVGYDVSKTDAFRTYGKRDEN